jgi:hypothetical protein
MRRPSDFSVDQLFWLAPHLAGALMLTLYGVSAITTGSLRTTRLDLT